MKNQKVTIVATDLPDGQLKISITYSPAVATKSKSKSGAITFSLDVLELINKTATDIKVTKLNERSGVTYGGRHPGRKAKNGDIPR